MASRIKFDVSVYISTTSVKVDMIILGEDDPLATIEYNPETKTVIKINLNNTHPEYDGLEKRAELIAEERGDDSGIEEIKHQITEFVSNSRDFTAKIKDVVPGGRKTKRKRNKRNKRKSRR